MGDLKYNNLTSSSRLRRITTRINFHILSALAAIMFITVCFSMSSIWTSASSGDLDVVGVIPTVICPAPPPAIICPVPPPAVICPVPSVIPVVEVDRPLILYAYFETENAKRNIDFFLKHGVHDGADFIFIINGRSTVKFPGGPHISLRKRGNTCFDVGSYAEVLGAYNNQLLRKYKRFIMMNASIRGPFLPTWSRECWSEAYLGQLNDEVKLVGMSVNCDEDHPKHIQSMIMATDRIGAEILIKENFKCYEDFEDAVAAEINSTTVLMNHGYKVKAFMTAFESEEDYMETCTNGDVLFNGTYFDTSIHPYETMFQKANRNIFPEQLELLTAWHDKSGYSSQPACGRKPVM